VFVPGADPAVQLWRGIECDLGRAIATAVLGDPTAIVFKGLSAGARFAELRDGSVDVLLRTTTHTLTRDALNREPFGGEGANFGPTYFYDGQGLLVDTSRPGFEDIGPGSTISDLPEGAVVCGLDIAALIFAEVAARDDLIVRVADSQTSLLGDFLANNCDVLTLDRSGLAGMKARNDTDGSWCVLGQTITKEPLASAVPDGDDGWSAIVRWCISAMFFAEERGITSENIGTLNLEDSWEVSRVFGSNAFETAGPLGLDSNWAFRVIEQVGNYGELYASNLEPIGLVRAGTLNASYDDGGLIYAPPIR